MCPRRGRAIPVAGIRFRGSPPCGSSVPAPAAVAAAAAAILARRARLARGSVLRPLDERLRRDELAVLVLGDELEADAAALLVDLLHDDVQRVAAGDDVLDVRD